MPPANTNQPVSRLYVRDDLGELWFFDQGNQRIVLVDDEADPESGYYCASLEEGVRLLNEYDYITLEG